MKYREFGNTGERVSALGFGLMRYNTFLGPKEKSSNCIECGVCLDKCPRQSPIPDELKNVNELFGRSGVNK